MTGVGYTRASSACPPDGEFIVYVLALDDRIAKLDANLKVQMLVIIGPDVATARRAESINFFQTGYAFYVQWRFIRKRIAAKLIRTYSLYSASVSS